MAASISAAGWLAAVGAALLLVASVVVVASNWSAIDPAVRFAGLVASLVAIYFAAETGRHPLPTTARALAALAALLTAPVGVAAAATLSQPWPVCTLVGGLAALVAAERQGRRWRLPVLLAATAGAYGLAAVGASASTGVPVIVLGAAGAAGALALGAPRRAVGLAAAVAVSPVVIVFAALGFGPGTLTRLGFTAGPLTWAAPLSCTVAAGVIAVVAQRHRNAALAVAALATFGVGVIVGFVAGGASPALWWSLPALAVLAAEATGTRTNDSMWRRIGRRVSLTVAPAMGVLAATLPTSALFAVAADEPFATALAWPAALTAIALVATAFGTGRRLTGERWTTAALVVAVGAAFASISIAGASITAAGALTVVGWALISARTPWRNWDLTTAIVMAWVALAAVADDRSPTSVRLGLLTVAVLATVLSVCSTRRDDGGARLIVAATVGALLGGALISWEFEQATFAPTAAIVFAALVTVGVALRRDQSLVPLAAAALVAVAVIAEQPVTGSSIALCALVGLAIAVTSRSATDVRAHLAASIGAITGALTLARLDIDPGTATMVGVLAATAFSGIAVVDRRLLPAMSAGLATSVLAVEASLLASAVFTSLALMVLGAHVALVGGLWKGRRAALPGTAVSVLALASTWWTTGANDWAIAQIAPYGATGIDIVVGVLAMGLLSVGAVARRHQALTSWIAYGPGLALAASWLLASQLEPGTDWATLGALALGVVALGIGGVRRLAAPLLAGTAMVAGTIVLSAGPRLASAPVWLWIAVGGAGLLVVAGLIERAERPLLPNGRDDDASIVEQFRNTFR